VGDLIRELRDVVIFWATKMVGPTYGLGPFVNGEGALLETALSPVSAPHDTKYRPAQRPMEEDDGQQ
jgi:hypothetical protein